MSLGRLVGRLFLRDLGDRSVFYPLGGLGGGYMVSPARQAKIEQFLGRWIGCLAAIVAVHVGLWLRLGDDALPIAAGLYAALVGAYVVRMAHYMRNLKPSPIQLGVSALPGQARAGLRASGWIAGGLGLGVAAVCGLAADADHLSLTSAGYALAGIVALASLFRGLQIARMRRPRVE